MVFSTWRISSLVIDSYSENITKREERIINIVKLYTHIILDPHIMKRDKTEYKGFTLLLQSRNL